MADRTTASLRWEANSSDGWFGYSGNFIAAIVTQIQVGTFAGKWAWQVSIPTKWVCVTDGRCSVPSAARRAANNAWSRFLDYAGLIRREAPHE